ncbi:MAG: ATP-binding protein [Bacteroidota bacterium]
MKQHACVIFCRCGAGIPDKTFNIVSQGLKHLDAHVYELQDLCAFSVSEPDVLNEISSRFEKKIIVACYPRAVKNMLKQGGVASGQFEYLNFKELTPDEIFSKIQNEHQVAKGEAFYQTKISTLNVPAWYPVVDESLCSLCGKCARFCLFGVYKYDKKSLKVVNPLACKNNCPACGRTCPTSAIMFPRLDEKSILAGAEPGSATKIVPENSLLLLLNNRNKERKNIFRQGVVQLAEEERRKALEEMKTALLKKDS